MVVNKVPAPALVIRTQQCNISMTLQRRILSSNAYHCHCAQWALPDHLPCMPPMPEPYRNKCILIIKR
nr:unnamed protein product [Callosobruchus chinensis]